MIIRIIKQLTQKFEFQNISSQSTFTNKMGGEREERNHFSMRRRIPVIAFPRISFSRLVSIMTVSRSSAASVRESSSRSLEGMVFGVKFARRSWRSVTTIPCKFGNDSFYGPKSVRNTGTSPGKRQKVIWGVVGGPIHKYPQSSVK